MVKATTIVVDKEDLENVKEVQLQSLVDEKNSCDAETLARAFFALMGSPYPDDAMNITIAFRDIGLHDEAVGFTFDGSISVL